MLFRSRNSLRRRVQVCAAICLATTTLTGARSSWAGDEAGGEPARGALNGLFRGMNVMTVGSPEAAAIVNAIGRLQREQPARVEEVTGSGELVGAKVVIDGRGKGFLAVYVQGRRNTGGLGHPEHLALSFGFPAEEQFRTAKVTVGNFNWETKATGPTRDFHTLEARVGAFVGSNRGWGGLSDVEAPYLRPARTTTHAGPIPMLRALDGNAASDAGSASRAFRSFCSGLRAAEMRPERQFITALLRATRQGKPR